MFSFCFSIEVGDSHHGPRHRSLMSPKHNRKSLFNNVSSALLSLLKLALPSPSPAAILGISFSFILFRTYTTVCLFWDIFNFSLCFLSSIKTAFNLSKIGHSYTKAEDQAVRVRNNSIFEDYTSIAAVLFPLPSSKLWQYCSELVTIYLKLVRNCI